MKSQIQKAMQALAKQPGAIFLGQGVAYPGVATYGDLEGVPMEQRLELPVIEELQMGMSIGLSLQGYLPISIYPRCDFILRAMDQLVNHLDKLAQMSQGQFQPKVIIRTRVGSKTPLDAGPQHTQNHSEAFRQMLNPDAVRVVEITSADQIMPAYEQAIARNFSSLIVESL